LSGRKQHCQTMGSPMNWFRDKSKNFTYQSTRSSSAGSAERASA
jgi:hypothetical protein